MWNSSKPIKFPHLWKLTNQSKLNKAHLIEITKACKLLLWKQEFPSLFDIQRNVSIDKKTRLRKFYFLKLPANRFWLTTKSCSWFNKAVYVPPSMSALHEKIMIFLLKVVDVQLVKNIPSEMVIDQQMKKKGMIKTINGCYI